MKIDLVNGDWDYSYSYFTHYIIILLFSTQILQFFQIKYWLFVGIKQKELLSIFIIYSIINKAESI